jgi:hypothetical protein
MAWARTETELETIQTGWVIWNYHLAGLRSDIARAAQQFEVDPAHASAATLTKWLREHALDDRTHAVHLLLRDGEVAAYCALSSSAVLIPAPQMSSMKLNERAPACHIAYVARDRRHPGAGQEALKHAARVARDVGQIQGTHVLVLDPYDAATATMWQRRYGFRESEELTPWDQPRLWLAVPARAS